MLPKELGQPVSEIVCCQGKIVRTECIEGQYGIAAKIDRFLASAPEPSAEEICRLENEHGNSCTKPARVASLKGNECARLKRRA